ncbi:MAG TPA: transglycosylase SLT domain-containing protein [Acetobacteraceae bacterium]|nr:transglycosylase SLT domain-containing protein [Acetobacteraceae bacterium]
MPAPDYSQAFDDAGREWNVDPRLLRSVMGQESGGNAGAVSPKGASGLMQVMPPTGVDLGVTNLKDPYQSIFAGAKYLSQQLDKYKDPALALAAYNAGPGRTDDYLNKRIPLPAETLGYVPSVIARYAQTKAQPAAGVPAVPQTATNPASAVPSDTDFLKMIGAAPAAPPAAAPTVNNAGEVVSPPATMVIKASPAAGGLPSDADFLKMIGASAAPAPAAAPAQQLIPDPNTGGLTAIPAAAPAAPTPPSRVDLPAWAGGQGTVTAEPTPQQPGVLQHIGQAIASPFVDGGPLGPDTSTGTLFNGPWGHTNRLMIAQPLALADAIGRGGLGAWRGLVAAGSEGLQGLGASPTSAANFERDLGGIAPNALAPLTMGADAALIAGVKNAGAPDVAANRLAAQTDIANRLQQNIANDVRGPARGAWLLDKIKTAINDADMPAPDANVPTGGVAPGMGAPRSAGAAATPTDAAIMSPAEARAQQSTAEMQKLIEPQPAGPDTNRYVPGVRPTEAQMVQNARTSRNEKLTASEMPQGFADLARDNNDARMNFLQDIAGTPTLQKRLMDDRSAQAEQDLASTWQNKQPADLTPVADMAANILNSPDGRRPLVRTAVDGVMRELTGPDGKPLTDPEMLYGVRKHIDDLIQGANDSAAGTRAVAQLQQLKDTLDGTIEQAAPGFRQYLSNFAAASKPIDEMSVLQAQIPKIVDSQNRITYSGVQRMMKNLVTARGGRGIDPAKSISDDTMNNLWALRDDLRRVASSDDLAKAKGSDTFQNALDFVKGAATKGGIGLAHVVANAKAPGIGSVAVNLVTNKLRQAAVAKAADRALNPKINRLNPPSD